MPGLKPRAQRSGEADQEPGIHVEDAAVGDARRQSVFRARGPWGKVAAKTGSDQRHPAGIHLGAGEHEVGHRGDHVLPIGTHRQVLFEEHRTLARPVEGQRVIPAGERGGNVVEVQLLFSAVITAGDDHRGPGPWIVVNPEEVAGKRGVRKGDGHDLRGVRHQRGAILKGLGLLLG